MAGRRIGIAVVGAGRWGPNLVRNFSALEACTVRWVCDLDAARAERSATSVGARAATSVSEVLSDAEVHAVAIATPAASHGALVHECFEADRHVFVEKPLTTTLSDALVLADLSTRRGLVLVCDHTYCFSAPVRQLRTLVHDGSLGELRCIDSTRVNCGPPQPDVDVFWDLGHHDLAILDFVLPAGQRPIALSARGVDTRGIGRACAGQLTVHMDGEATAYIRLDWMGTRKVRTMRFEGSSCTARWDDLVEPRRLTIDSDDRIIIDDGTEALHGAVRDFVSAIGERRTPTISVAAELRVLRMLEATTRSLNQRGVPVRLLSEGAA